MEYFKIDKNEVLRYLGYKGQQLDSELSKKIDCSILECYKVSAPRYYYQIFDSDACEQGIRLQGTEITLKGTSIFKHLEHARQVAVLAATLGVNFDNHVRMLEQVSMTDALIMDACGTEYIEKVCDTVEQELSELAGERGYITNFRFSPGYGDFPLEQQPQVTALLDTSRKIGLTCTPQLIMLPRKSVTAVVGFLPKGYSPGKRSCENCAIKQNCNFRKEGKTCGA